MKDQNRTDNLLVAVKHRRTRILDSVDRPVAAELGHTKPNGMFMPSEGQGL